MKYKKNIKKANISLKSIFTKQLDKKQIKEICLLKESFWKFGISLQLNWFKKNIKRNDIHNLFYIKSKLIGYTLLMKRTFNQKNLISNNKYLLFDTLIISKKYRNKKLSNLLMAFNNLIIEKSGFFSFLICKKEMIKFYKKNHWVNISSKNVNVKDHPFNHYSMIYNCKNTNKKIDFYVNK